jgi:hypothetical protein
MVEGVIPRPSIAERVRGMNEEELRQQMIRMLEANEVGPALSPC